jgi:hypothetical protein
MYQQPAQQIFCPHCHGGNPIGAVKCMWCHRPLQTAQVPQDRRNGALVGFGIGALVLGTVVGLCSLVLLIYGLSQPVSEGSGTAVAVLGAFMLAAILLLVIPGVIMIVLGSRRQ